MTKDTFVKIVKSVIKDKGVTVYSSKESKLADIGRQVERREIDFDEAAEKVKEAFSDEYALGKDDFKAIAKQLKRY
jgi:hypothetical protein